MRLVTGADGVSPASSRSATSKVSGRVSYELISKVSGQTAIVGRVATSMFFSFLPPHGECQTTPGDSKPRRIPTRDESSAAPAGRSKGSSSRRRRVLHVTRVADGE